MTVNTTIPNGVWPTMITPFTDRGAVDYRAAEAVVEWYIRCGVQGIFAVCQSSEMFYLSLQERLGLARFVQDKAAGRAVVVASGHTGSSITAQIEELKALADTGVEALVLVTNRLAGEGESDDVWRSHAERILESIPDIPFGLYECPYPYKRLVSPELLAWCAASGRFVFLKDTSCSLEDMEAKLAAVEDSSLKIYNANAATLFLSLGLGVAGYSGVMANFHADLYVWLHRHWRQRLREGERLQAFLGLASVIERQLYPVNAKYHFRLEGIPIHLHCRTQDADRFTAAQRLEVEQLQQLTSQMREQYRLDGGCTAEDKAGT